MPVSSGTEVGPPSYEDFEVLKWTFLELGSAPHATIFPSADQLSLYMMAKQTIPEIDERAALRNELVLRPYTIHLLGKLSTFHGGNKLLLRYKEMSLSPGMRPAGLAHDYILQTQDGEVIEFGQSIRAIPCDMPEPPIQSSDIFYSDQKLDEVQSGGKILRQYLGNQLELSAGDCGVLFDRVHEYFL